MTIIPPNRPNGRGCSSQHEHDSDHRHVLTHESVHHPYNLVNRSCFHTTQPTATAGGSHNTITQFKSSQLMTICLYISKIKMTDREVIYTENEEQ